jgi:benzoyl-CoA reductase/2-hydroxyglutaryl-CoA dehydratase subunit BcrC/BadD/HgdB
VHNSCYLYSCRLAGLAQPVLKKTISERLGIPVLVLEGDLYDSRNYSAEQLRTRVESFVGMLKMAKAAKRA